MPPLGPQPLNPKERVLAEWRGVDLSAAERSRPVKGMDDIMPGVIKKLRLEQRQVEAQIVRVWNSIMDPNIAAHAKPDRMVNRTLCVIVDSNAWLDEILRYRRKEILDRLHHSFGREMVQKISFRLG